VNARAGAPAKSTGQPYARNGHVRLEEGAPVGAPCGDTQALPTERGSHSYGLATAPPDRALLYSWCRTARISAWRSRRDRTMDRREASRAMSDAGMLAGTVAAPGHKFNEYKAIEVLSTDRLLRRASCTAHRGLLHSTGSRRRRRAQSWHAPPRGAASCGSEPRPRDRRAATYQVGGHQPVSLGHPPTARWDRIAPASNCHLSLLSGRGTVPYRPRADRCSRRASPLGVASGPRVRRVVLI
jgi:hypothetical protein